jgi:hypothetical protein
MDVLSRLNKACYAIRAIKPSMRMIYHSYVHSILSYSITFLDNAPYNESIFKIQKRIVRVITSSGRLDSYCGIFKKITNTATSVPVYLISTPFCHKKRNHFIANTDTHDIDTHYNYNLYLPSINLSIVQNGVLFSGSTIYNNLPLNIQLFSKDTKVFKSLLRSFLIENVSYSSDEYYNFTSQ